MAKKTDQELVELCLENEGNLVYLIDRYESRLLTYIHRITNISHEEAEDLLQEIFIKMYQNLAGYDTSLKFSSWIYRIAHNQVISNYRKIKSRKIDETICIDEKIINTLAGELDLNVEMDKKILKTNIIKVLDRMDVKYKEVLVLKFFEQRDYNEMSDILKKPKGTIATLMNRAKKQFRKISESEEIIFN